MSADKKQVVVQGEAFESDDEDSADEIGQESQVSRRRARYEIFLMVFKL